MRSIESPGFVCSLVVVGMLAGITGCSEGLPEAGAASPEVAQETGSVSTIGVPAGCSPQGMPRVVATHVVPGAPITATTDHSKVWLRFGTTKSAHELASVNVQSLDAEVAPQDTASEPQGSATPGAARLPEGKSLVAWTADSNFSSWRMKGLANSAESDAVDLGYQGAAIGRPAIAVTPEGEGVLAFVESNGAGFQLVATRVVCSVQ
jgi:hypothetical protein